MQFPKTWIALVVLVALISLVALVALPGFASEDTAVVPLDAETRAALEKDRRKKAGTYSLGKRVSRYNNAAAKEIDAGDSEAAAALLNRLYMNRLNPFERAQVYRMLAYAAHVANDGRAAIENFEKVLALEMLPIKDETRIRFQIAQLYASVQEWQLMIDWLKKISV